LAIIYVYFVKVIFFEELPKGMTSYLILSFCGAGTLVYILVLEESKNIAKGVTRFFEKWFFRTVLPLLFLLWYAIYERVGEYGITERRYILIVLAVLLTIWTVYFVFSRKKNIVFIPFLLVATSFFISFGPWGVFETSFRSQRKRLVEILNNNKLIENGVIVSAENEVSFEDRKNISSILLYIESRWGLERIQDMVPEEVKIKNDSHKRNFTRYNYQNSSTIDLMDWMGLKYVTEWDTVSSSDHYSLYLNMRADFSVKGPFDGMIVVHCPDYRVPVIKDNGTTVYEAKSFETENFKINFSKDCKEIEIFQEDAIKYRKTLTPVITEIVERKGKTNKELTAKELSFSEENDEVKIKMVFTHANGGMTKNKDDITINSLSIYLFYKIK
jgi:hypothetical protein